jgi:hypothetical protein
MKREARTWRNDLQLRRSVKQLLSELELDVPLNIRVLCDRLGERRGQPIKLLPYPLPVPGVFGLWLSMPTADYILYQKNTTRGHQEHIILHEIGHIISGHKGNEDDNDIATQLFPDLPPDLIRRHLRRDGYEPAFEREAEMVATVIKEWATLLEHLEFTSYRKSDRRIRGAFDDHQGWL